MEEKDFVELKLYIALRKSGGWKELDRANLCILHDRVKEFDNKLRTELSAAMHLLFEITKELNKNAGSVLPTGNVPPSNRDVDPKASSAYLQAVRPVSPEVDVKVQQLSKQFTSLKKKDLEILAKSLQRKLEF